MTRLPNSKLKKGNYEFTGSVLAIRAIEDCIRASHKFNKYFRLNRGHHPTQGEDFPSNKFYERYEVYPDIEWGIDMQLTDLLILAGHGAPIVNVVFNYDYRVDKASMVVEGKLGGLEKLLDGIPGLCHNLLPDMVDNGRQGEVSRMLKDAIKAEEARQARAVSGEKKSATAWSRLTRFLTPRKDGKV